MNLRDHLPGKEGNGKGRKEQHKGRTGVAGTHVQRIQEKTGTSDWTAHLATAIISCREFWRSSGSNRHKSSQTLGASCGFRTKYERQSKLSTHWCADQHRTIEFHFLHELLQKVTSAAELCRLALSKSCHDTHSLLANSIYRLQWHFRFKMTEGPCNCSKSLEPLVYNQLHVTITIIWFLPKSDALLRGRWFRSRLLYLVYRLNDLGINAVNYKFISDIK